MFSDDGLSDSSANGEDAESSDGEVVKLMRFGSLPEHDEKRGVIRRKGTPPAVRGFRRNSSSAERKLVEVSRQLRHGDSEALSLITAFEQRDTGDIRVQVRLIGMRVVVDRILPVADLEMLVSSCTARSGRKHKVLENLVSSVRILSDVDGTSVLQFPGERVSTVVSECTKKVAIQEIKSGLSGLFSKSRHSTGHEEPAARQILAKSHEPA